MATWQVTDERLAVPLAGLTEGTLRIVAGEVVVAAGEGEPLLEVDRTSGPPVEVSFEDGRLHVRHANPGGQPGVLGLLGRFLGGEEDTVGATVALRCPPSTPLQISTVSAPVVATGLGARTGLKTVSGDVTLKDVAGQVDAKTVSGDLDAIGVAAELRLKTVSGSMSVVDGACRWVEGKSVSGDFVLDLDLDPRGVYSFKTVSGLVALRTGADPSVLVEASSVSGSVVSDFDLDWEDDRPGRRRLHRSIGGGEARLVVKTVSGDLRLLERRVAA